MTDQCRRCNSLSAALKEALVWLYVEGKKPPYRVPCAIDHDLWMFKRVPTAEQAFESIDEAIAKTSPVK